jgi:hypothetical protein
MRKNIPGILICMLLISSIVVGAGITTNEENEIPDGTISVKIPIGAYEIESTEYGDEISINDFGHLFIPGKPNLPSKIFSIAIPPGAEIVDVSFKLSEGVIIQDNYDVPPGSLPRVIGEENPEIYRQEQKIYEENYKSTYLSDNPFPSSNVEFIRTAGFRKYNLADVRVNPFTYYPLSGQLIYHPEVDVFVSYEFPEGCSPDNVMIDNIPDMEKRAERIILNYNQAKTWYPTGPLGQDTYDFVIITTDSLQSYVQDLKSWEEVKGKSVNVVTTSWISSNYDGYDLAEKMRNFLRDKYPSGQWGIEDVCLVGHYDDVPMRRCWQDPGYGKPETDYYYAELSLPDSQSWDADGDHKWGENSDPIDFYAEVNVGRIPWSDGSTVEDICDKSVAYEQSNDNSFKRNILLLGAFFWPDTDNAVLMEEKIDQIWMSDWTKTRMYEEGHSSYSMDYNLDYNNVKNVWSSGKYAFVNWAGHGSPTACYEYYPSQAFVNTATCNYLNDNYPAIIFADACSNSDTDYLNIGQAMMKQGAVGFLGATKVAYGLHAWDDPYDGSSQSMDYFFTTKTTSGDYTQGEAHQWALLEMYTNNLWYYVKYEMFEWGALWGNPDLGMTYVPTQNYPPNEPSDPDPYDGETDVELDADLFWTCTDPNGDSLTYDVYFGTSSSPPLVSSGQIMSMYDPGTLTSGETYYWKIVAEDDEGESTEGPIWSFTCWINYPPNMPYHPNPWPGDTDVDVETDLSWLCSDPNGDPLVYDVYLEANDETPDVLVSYHQSQPYYDPPDPLEYETHYWWRINAWDPYGEETTGYIWDFTTGSIPNNPPNEPSDPDPWEGATEIEIDADLHWVCSDPDEDDLFYDVYFEANDPSPDVLVSNDQTENSYDPETMTYETTYYWQIVAKDEYGAATPGPIWHFTTKEELNLPPGAPTIKGPNKGRPEIKYEYTLNAVDPNGDDVRYHIDWGDGGTGLTGFNPSGSDLLVSHSWDEEKVHIVKVYAEDSKGLFGPETTLTVTIPRTRVINIFILNFFENHPVLFSIIKLVIQRLGL